MQDSNFIFQHQRVAAVTALIERAVEDGDWPLAWMLMETGHFSCGKFNILRNGIPDIISIYHDKVKNLTEQSKRPARVLF